jgi:hypothetical protein
MTDRVFLPIQTERAYIFVTAPLIWRDGEPFAVVDELDPAGAPTNSGQQVFAKLDKTQLQAPRSAGGDWTYSGPPADLRPQR